MTNCKVFFFLNINILVVYICTFVDLYKVVCYKMFNEESIKCEQ